MRTILVPTDYSETARNAVFYAAELTKRLAGKLTLFHAYHVPMRMAPGSAAAAAMPASGEEMEAEEIKKLRYYTEAIKSRFSATSMGHVIRAGFAVEEIVNYSAENNIDLVVMGSKGEGGRRESLGTIATNVIQESKTPVLAVPEGARFKSRPKIALAYDFSGIDNPAVLDLLGDIVKAFGTELLIVDVLRRKDQEHDRREPAIERLVSGIDHSFHFPVSDDPAEEVLNFIEENNVDMLAIIPHKHGFFDRLIRDSFTRKMALHTHVPLLALPG